jgi:paraquat-inducible protein A
MAAGAVRARDETRFAAIGGAARRARSWAVPLALAAAAASLAAGVALPIIRASRFFVIARPLSNLDGVQILLADGDWLLAAIIAGFSIVWPAVKIVVLAGLWVQLRRGASVSLRLIAALDSLGKWSMLDVFVVALAIVMLKTGALTDATAAPALYPFIAAILLTAFASREVARQARSARAVRRVPVPPAGVGGDPREARGG